MIIVGDSKEDVINKGTKIFRCEPDNLEIRTLKKPIRALFGIIKKEGKYWVDLTLPKSKVTSHKKSKNGHIEIANGKAVVTDPVGEGDYATIDPTNPNLEVYLNGSKINTITWVTEKDSIELRPVIKKAITEIKVELSRDKMKATLTVTKTPGKRYYVIDAPKTRTLTVPLGCEDLSAPQITVGQCIQELKNKKVNTKFINLNAIKDLLEKPKGGSALVAEGIYPIDGRPSEVKYLFESKKIRNPAFKTDERVDPMDHTILPSVEIGQVLAIKEIFAIPGRDGETVIGEVVKAKPAKKVPFKAGKGAILLERDTKIVASRSGRPVLRNGIVSVVPLMVIPGDVTPQTGNIYFNGDVYIKGHVTDNMKVVADGNIFVSGSVLQATLASKGSIYIAGNIICSRITAGAAVVNSLCIMPMIKQIAKAIRNDFTDASWNAWPRDYGKIVESHTANYFERRQSLEEVAKEIKDVAKLLPTDDCILINEILEKLRALFIANNLANEIQIQKLNKKVQEYLTKTLNVEGREDADIRFRYAQNSFIQSSGKITVLGRGTYYTDIISKKSINFLNPMSVVLGGTLIANKSISAGTVGSSYGITTHCKVLDANGKIDALRFHSKTTITINGEKHDGLTFVEKKRIPKIIFNTK